MAAKDKQYKDGTLLSASKHGPNAAQAIQGAAYGVSLGKVWVFAIKVDDFTYFATLEHGKVKDGDWQDNSQVKIRFEKQGGFVASRTTLYLFKPDGKELEFNVRSIVDEAGNDYCGNRKCDPESAAEKKAKGKG